MNAPALLNDLSPPPWLNADATAHWNRIAPLLRACEVLTVMDGAALSILCDYVGLYQGVQRQLAQGGLAARDDEPEIPEALIEMRSYAIGQVHDWGEKFVVCPASRLAVEGAIPPDMKPVLKRYRESIGFRITF